MNAPASNEMKGALQACVEAMNQGAELFGALQAAHYQLSDEQRRAIALLGKGQLEEYANILDLEREKLADRPAATVDGADLELARSEVRDAYRMLTLVGDLLAAGDVQAAQALVVSARKACTFAHEALDGEMLMPRPFPWMKADREG